MIGTTGLQRGRRFGLGFGLVCGLLGLSILSPGTLRADPIWANYAGDGQHTALSSVASQPLDAIRWSTPVDDVLQHTHGPLLIHFGSPTITQADTVIVPVRGANDAFRLEAHNGSNGSLVWSASTDYILPPHNNIWVPSYSPALTPNTNQRLYYAGAGGTVYYRDNPDSANGPGGQLAFYGPLSVYNSHKAVLNANVEINTPITADKSGNIFFGYQVSGSDPVLNQLGLGSSGIAMIDALGHGTFKSITSLVGADANKVATNSGPALSKDGNTLYVAVNSGDFTAGDLIALSAKGANPLTLQAKVRLKDPQSGNNSYISDSGSASPMVGPNGDVFFGVLENTNSYASKGWMLHFKSNLTPGGLPGLFGWDDTASIVPTSMLPKSEYNGNAPYLLMTKYNNYKDFGLDGKNKLAILDPFDPTGTIDPRTGVTGMKEVITITGVTPDGPPAGAVREWCINSAVVDPATDSVLANSEDGKLYRWDLGTNTFSQVITLTQGVGEAYTPTLIGADGSVYAINDAVLFAVGLPPVSVPEPSSIALGLVGAALAGFWGLRRRHAPHG